MLAPRITREAAYRGLPVMANTSVLPASAKVGRFISQCRWRCSNNATRQGYGTSCESQCAKIAGEFTRRAGMRERAASLAQQEAKLAYERLRWETHVGAQQRSVCRRTAPVLAHRSKGSGTPVQVTSGMRWRYFSLLECGDSSGAWQLCLVFKDNVQGNRLYFARSSDGLSFKVARMSRASRRHERASWLPLFHGTTFGARSAHDALLAHNFAVLRLPPSRAQAAEFVIMGGMETRGASGIPRGVGIHFARGSGWPWNATTWSWPRVVIAGGRPAGCIDRRPSRLLAEGGIGAAQLAAAAPACEFDGRLSLVYFRGEFRLFARANLFESAIAGGRFVQSTTSVDGYHWNEWRLVRIRLLPAGLADLYFFAVQPNPVDPSSLMSIFPVSQPPDACIALAFSRDGVEWSAPHPLQTSRLGWRTAKNDGFGPIEWRNEDHPVAGAYAAQSTGDDVWIYIHHAGDALPVSSASLARFP